MKQNFIGMKKIQMQLYHRNNLMKHRYSFKKLNKLMG